MKKITSFGEILFDIYPSGRKLGGAPFNFIYHIKKLTGNGNFISRIGSDLPGDEIFWFMRSHFMSTRNIQIDNEHPTGSAYANLDDNRIPHWKISTNSAYDFIEKEENLFHLIENNTDCLYYGTLVQRNEISQRTLQSLFGKKKKYFCDLNIRQEFYSKEIIETSIKAANVLKLNIDELKIVNDLFFRSRADEISIAKNISEKFEVEIVCVTLGENGAILYSHGKSDCQKTETENIVDTVGAGDAYSAILCLGIMENWRMSKINKIANEFSSAIIGIEGALPNDDSFYDKYKDEFVNA